MLNETIRANCKALGYNLEEYTPENKNVMLESIAFNLGYKSLNAGNTYEDGSRGLLIQMNNTTYNNGVYMLHLNNNGEYLLETVVPNTADKGMLINQVVSDITGFIDGLDTADLGVYDMVEIYGHVIANTVVKRLAKTLFPNNKTLQTQFITVYMPRFLSNVAILYNGYTGEADRAKFLEELKEYNVNEERLNSEPYVLKMMLEGDPDLNLVPKGDQDDEGE